VAVADCLLAGQVSNRVSYLRLRYEDGERTQVSPHAGFVLTKLAAAHWRRGHRLISITGYSASGEAVGRQSFEPSRRNTYPCARRKDYGYGVKMCP
jgi:hypothetical protein